MLKVVRRGHRRPLGLVPCQPAQHLDLRVGVVRRPHVGARVVAQVGHDRRRFPDHTVAVLQQGCLAIGVECSKCRRAQAAPIMSTSTRSASIPRCLASARTRNGACALNQWIFMGLPLVECRSTTNRNNGFRQAPIIRMDGTSQVTASRRCGTFQRFTRLRAELEGSGYCAAARPTPETPAHQPG